MKNRIKDERGMVIVEATFVFPIMFFILFFLLYTGNAFYQKAKVDALAAQYAVLGASRSADPLLDQITASGSVTENGDDIDSQPYRYFTSMQAVAGNVQTQLREQLNGSGFYLGMEPNVTKCEAKFNNYVLYHTFSAEVNYVIEFPIRFLGSDNVELLRLSSRAEVPVNDVGNFIRNTDMAVDYIEQNEQASKALEKIGEAFDKVKRFFSGD